MAVGSESMIRTQLHFTPLQLARGKRLASDAGISFAELVRRAVDAYPPSLSAEDEEALEALAQAVLHSKEESDESMSRALSRLDELEQNMEERRRGDS